MDTSLLLKRFVQLLPGNGQITLCDSQSSFAQVFSRLGYEVKEFLFLSPSQAVGIWWRQQTEKINNLPVLFNGVWRHLQPGGFVLWIFPREQLAAVQEMLEQKSEKDNLAYPYFVIQSNPQLSYALLHKPDPEGENPLSVKAALQWGEWLLSDLPDAALEAKELLKFALELSNEQEIYLASSQLLSSAQEHKYLQAIKQRQQSIPVAYITGKRGFMGWEFIVTPDVLIPRPETELLVEYVTEQLTDATTGLDLGTGSGCIVIALAKLLPDTQFSAVELSGAALAVAEKNAQALGVAEKITFYQGDLFSALPDSPEPFSLIVSNPPYIAKEEYHQLMPEVHKEPSLALLAEEEGLEFYRKILEQAPAYLARDGHLLLEIGIGQLPKIKQFVPPPLSLVEVINDYANIPRIIVLRKIFDNNNTK